MLLDNLKSNIRLLERLTVFKDSDDIPGVPGTADYLFLSVLRLLQCGDLPAAKQQYKQLADVLGVQANDAQLEPLRTILHLQHMYPQRPHAHPPTHMHKATPQAGDSTLSQSCSPLHSPLSLAGNSTVQHFFCGLFSFSCYFWLHVLLPHVGSADSALQLLPLQVLPLDCCSVALAGDMIVDKLLLGSGPRQQLPSNCIQVNTVQLCTTFQLTACMPSADLMHLCCCCCCCCCCILQLWEGDAADRQQLQQYLIDQLGLGFEAEPPGPAPPAPPGLDDTPGPSTDRPQPAAPKPQTPSHLTPDQYSTEAFQQLIKEVTSKGQDGGHQPLQSLYDPSTFLQVMADGSLPLKQRVKLLQQGPVPLALLPTPLLVQLVESWVAEQSWKTTPATKWVTGNWAQFTKEQATALRAVLPGPGFGFDPNIDRPYIAALVTKALAGPAAAAAAGGASTDESGVAPWGCGAPEAAAAADLRRVLEVCDELGPAADWIRLHALHAQLQLQQKQQPCVDQALLVSFMQLLGRATWTPGPTVTDTRAWGRQQQPPPPHVPCSVCGMCPIVGPRMRSRTRFRFNVCWGCSVSAEAVAAGPLEEVKVDDSIYMVPKLPLPEVLGELTRNEAQRQAEVRKMLLELVQQDGADGRAELFTADGPCPLAAAGLLLPQAWRDAAVAEGKLLSGRGDTTAWSKLYQQHADMSKLCQQTELSFAPHHRDHYSLDEGVVLQLDTKNTGPQGVLVKVYEINTWNYYTSQGKEVDLNLELAGVAPSNTISLKTPQDPIIRSRHSIPLGLAGAPGVWLVEVVAGGKRARARILKGALHLTQRPSAAGQVISVMDEQWRPVQGVRIWCEGKEIASSSTCNEVLLPYGREQKQSPLVVAAKLAPGAGGVDAAADKECVVLFPDFERLQEHYSLRGRLLCHQEALLPGQTVPLLLQLNLQLHGQAAPLQLLQEVQLRLLASTSDGAEVPQVFKDLKVNPVTGELALQYSLPQGTTRLAATLTARLLLALPGTNGEPDWQEFEVCDLLPGRSGPSTNIQINTAAGTSSIWDVYLTTRSSSSSSSQTSSAASGPHQQPEYVLQVLGRSGEPPAVPKTLTVWLSHVNFNPYKQLKFTMKTAPDGTVNLGHLAGIRQVAVRLAGGLDHVEDEAVSEGQTAAGGAVEGSNGGDGSAGAGPTRSWQVARASWWQGGLDQQYTIPVGEKLELTIRPAAGQSITAALLQLVDPSKGGGGSSSISAAAAAVRADITAGHLEVIPAAVAATAAAGGSCLGCGDAAVLRVQGLAAGLYRLVVPALLLEAPAGAYSGQEWCSSGKTNLAIHINVLPMVAAPATADARLQQIEPGGAGESSLEQQLQLQQAPWLWAGGDSTASSCIAPAVLHPSEAQQLHVTSLTCSAAGGLAVQLTGTPEQLAEAQLVAVFHRFLYDSSVDARSLSQQTKLPWDAVDACAQACGGFGRCSYSSAAKLDSAVAYVLQRRQWEQEGGRAGGKRPGSLLERPSLLVMPKCVRSAASGTSVLRGGDGGRVMEAADSRHKMMKKMAAPSPAAYYSSCAAAGAAPGASCFAQYSGTCSAPLALTSAQQQQGDAFGFRCPQPPAVAQAPVLGFIKNPAVVLTGLQPHQDGSLLLSADQLGKLLQEAAAAAAADGPSSDNSSPGSVLGSGGYTVCYVSAYVPLVPGQFSSCSCSIAGAVEPEAAVLPRGRRDLGLMRDVEEDAICALTCDVLSMLPGASLVLPNADACEVAVYGSMQQLYHLLAGLLELSETGAVPRSLGAARGGMLGGCRPVGALLPRPCVPPKGGAHASSLLRQWEPLLLTWPRLSSAARLELLGKLGSTELIFFLACRDTRAYQQLVLPLLRSKLPSELCCLEQILLLQAAYGQPAIPGTAAAAAAGTPAVSSAADDPAGYEGAKQELLQHWYAPYRYQKLTVLEQVLLAALEGTAALLQYGQDMRRRLESPADTRGVTKSWMSSDRRSLFDFALLLSRQLEQQQEQEQQQQRRRQRDAEAAEEADQARSVTSSEFEDLLQEEQEDADEGEYVNVRHADAAMFGAAAGGGGGDSGFMFAAAAEGAAGPVPPPPPAMAMAAMPPTTDYNIMPRKATMREGCFVALAADLSARAQVVAAAAGSARLAPQETQEWAEAGWWKFEGQQPPAGLIPASPFWADYAIHLANNPEQPFIPTDPTGAAASTAAVVAALAVVGLPWEGAPASTFGGSAAAAAAAAGTGCSRSYSGSTLTLTARSASLLWVKQVKAVANISATAAAAAATAPSATEAVVGGNASAASLGGVISSSADTVMVTERLFDPRLATATDPETGEQLLLSLLPNEQQPLLAGQSYCHSVVVTSTGPSEQQLDILVQLPQGALPLAGCPGTQSVSITLAPFATHQLSSMFYFPEGGLFKRATVSVTKRGKPVWLPSSSFPGLHVAPKPLPGSAAKPHQSLVTAEFSWSTFIRAATAPQILEYLRTGDLSVARLADVSPYCRDLSFFTAATSALNNRHTFDYDIWKWAVAHMHGPALQQLLPLSVIAERVAAWKLPLSKVGLLQLSSRDVGLQHLEYWPWVNPYCRPIPRDDGGDSSLPSVLADNPNIAQQWRNFLLAALFNFSATPDVPGSSRGANGLDLAHAAAAACYLLLQDRVSDADQVLSGGNVAADAEALPEGAPLRMQVDYLRAWLALSKPLPAAAGAATAAAAQHLEPVLVLAKGVVARYKDCAAAPWRKRFAQLASMVKELEQQVAAVAALQNPTAMPPQAVAAVTAAAEPDSAAAASPEDSSPLLSVVSCEGGKLKLMVRGLTELTLSAYHIDTELLFTTQPFSSLSSNTTTTTTSIGYGTGSSRHGSRGDADGGLGKVAYVAPSARVTVQLSAAGEAGTAADAGSSGGVGVVTHVLELDDLMPQLAAQSVLLEVSGGGLSRTLPRFASRLVVHVLEDQGILQACYSPAAGGNAQVLLPAAAVYVKVFARDSRNEWFYKDGYTDLRGKFDYVTLTSTDDMSRVVRYSLLVASAELGAVMMQAAPLPK